MTDWSDTWKNKLITHVQSGFHKNRSTTDQLVQLESFVREAFIQKQHVVAVFFDLEKAYDTTWKYGIMKDLYDAGLRGRLPLFVQGFLHNRQFQVRLGSHIYDKCKKLTSLKLIVRTMQRYHTTKTAKIFWVTLDGATHGASISCPMHSYI